MGKFEHFEREHLRITEAGLAPWFSDYRKAALSRFLAQGLPSKKLEEWRYTDLGHLAEVPFLTSQEQPRSSALGDLAGFTTITLGAPLPNISGVRFYTTKDVPESLQKQATISLDPKRSDSLESLNAGLAEDLLFIDVEPGAAVKTGLRLVHQARWKSSPMVSNPRVFVRLGRGAALTVLEEFDSIDGTSDYFVNSVASCLLEQGSTLSWGRLESGSRTSWHVGHNRFTLKEGSSLESFVLASGAGTQRHSVYVAIEGANARAKLSGLSLVEKNQHIDHYTVIDHLVPDATSEQLYKTVLAENARGVFNGRIVIHKKAARTSTRQLNKNLVLGQKAEVDTRPQLEIFNDDVKASHGATIGRLNPDEVFYLQSRGLAKAQAMALLARGFAQDAATHLSDTRLREIMLNEIKSRLGVFTKGMD